MNITKEQIDDLNAVVKVAIQKVDLEPKVKEVLNGYRKQANIPGFRKGHVPYALIKKQYGKAVLVDEVNKMLQDNLNKYITEEKLAILGNPLPKEPENFDWDAEQLAFEFELGLAPKVKVSLKTKKATTHYHVVADKKAIQEQVENYQKRFGKLVSQNTVAKGCEITGHFTNEVEGIDREGALLELALVKSSKTIKTLVGKKVGDTVAIQTKGLFEDDWRLVSLLGINREQAKKLDVTVNFTISEINERVLAELNQDLFDKIYGEGNITSEEHLRNEIKEVAERTYLQQSDQKLLNDITEKLIEETKFDLPAKFLTKWMKENSQNPISEEEAKAEYEQSEKALRYQLIESEIIKEHGLEVDFEEIKNFAKEYIKNQMMQYGQMNPDEELIENLAMRTLSNQEEMQQLRNQLMSKKMLELFKEKCNLKKKEVNLKEFIEQAYGD